jgi:hypothetical protein
MEGSDPPRASQRGLRSINFHMPMFSTDAGNAVGVRLNSLLFIVLLSLAVPGWETTTTTMPGPSSGSTGRREAPRGFFDKLTDAITERECSVAHFTCPYGFGAADEPCDCTDPRGVVLQGRTVK